MTGQQVCVCVCVGGCVCVCVRASRAGAPAHPGPTNCEHHRCHPTEKRRTQARPHAPRHRDASKLLGPRALRGHHVSRRFCLNPWLFPRVFATLPAHLASGFQGSFSFFGLSDIRVDPCLRTFLAFGLSDLDRGPRFCCGAWKGFRCPRLWHWVALRSISQQQLALGQGTVQVFVSTVLLLPSLF